MKIIYGDKEYNYTGNKNIKVYDVLQELNMISYAPCGGKGTCGKCKVRVIFPNGTPKLDAEEERLLTEEEKESSIRLACRLHIEDDMIVHVMNSKEKGFNILSDFRFKGKNNPCIRHIRIKREAGDLHDQRSTVTKVNEKSNTKHEFSIKAIRQLSKIVTEAMNKNDEVSDDYVLIIDGNTIMDIQVDKEIRSYGIAIDIGSTTIAAALINFISGEIIGIEKCLNSQKKYGSDIISRIQYMKHKDPVVLNQAIKSDINNIVNLLCTNYSIKKENIYKVAISGNTTMLHFLLNLEPYSIAASPFVTTTTEFHEYRYYELFDNSEIYCNVAIMPGISAYVGADILLGLYNCEIQEKEKPCMLIDIGTNGEVAIGNKDKIMCAATAAGPAFEGANIKNGIGSVEGAIFQIDYNAGQLEYKTIQDKPAIGICGSGVVDSVACMLRNRFIDSYGILDERFNGKVEISKENNIFMYQEDIEQLQFAKSALRSGIELIIKEYGCEYEEIDKVYIAGGFGNNVRISSLVDIGLIPKELENKVELIGNSSLGGTIDSLLSKDTLYTLKNIIDKTKYIELSKNREFNNLYIDYMLF